MTGKQRNRLLTCLVFANLCRLPAFADDEALARYLARVRMSNAASPTRTLGSLWVDSGRMAALSSDYKAANIGDLVTILVVQDVTASNTGSVSTDRSLKANSGIDTLPGKINTSGVNPLFALHSADSLSGKGAATTTSKLRTSLAGRVVAVLPSGNLVIEAERSVTMNNERQNIVIRGVIRPGDVGPENTVLSNNIGNLELEIKGKGVISDGTRRPVSLLRLIMRVLVF